MYWPRYVPVAERRAKALKEMNKLRKKGKIIQPVEINGRIIARSFWGKGWCDHLESFSDYENRLPRGRTYVRNSSVCHLEIQPGLIEAIVSGSRLYNVSIKIKEIEAAKWKAVKAKCLGQIGSLLELLQGKLSDSVMEVVTDRENGLFPLPGEINLSCSCPDWATMCKHVAAVLYGVGSRLDSAPELLFLLRGVEAEELISAEITLPQEATDSDKDILHDDQLGDIFDIDLDLDESTQVPPKDNAKQTQPGKSPSSKAKRREGKKKNKAGAGRSPKKKKDMTAGTKQSQQTENKAETPIGIRPSGKSVTSLRKKLGLSVPQFAERVGVTPPTIYRWESIPGKLKIQKASLKALASLHEETKKTK